MIDGEILKSTRTTHLALMGLCFALLAAILVQPKADLELATAQLDQAEAISEAAFSHWWRDKIAERDTAFGRLPCAAVVRVSGKHVWTLDHLERGIGGRVFPSVNRGSQGELSAAVRSLAINRQRNLTSLRELWNGLEVGLQAERVSALRTRQTEIEVIAPVNEQATLTFKYPDENGECAAPRRPEPLLRTGGEPPSATTRSYKDLENKIYAIHFNGRLESLGRLEFVARVPFVSKPAPIDIRKALLRYVGRAPIEASTIENVFPDLYFAARDVESLEYEQLRTYLNQLRHRRNETVSVLGAQMERGSMALLGLLAICGIQLYLLVHLQHINWLLSLKLEFDPGQWWLFADEALAQLFSMASLLVLPILTSFGLVFYSYQIGWGYFAVLSLIFCLASYLSVRSAQTMLAVGRTAIER